MEGWEVAAALETIGRSFLSILRSARLKRPDQALKLFLEFSMVLLPTHKVRREALPNTRRSAACPTLKKVVHPVNGEVPPVKGRPRKLPHYANRGKTTSSGGELASARSCFSTVRTALGKLRITGLLAQFDVARSFPQFPRPLLLQPTILTSERGTRFGIRKAPNHVPTSPFTG